MKLLISTRAILAISFAVIMVVGACDDGNVGVDPVVKPTVTVEIGLGQSVTVPEYSIKLTLIGVLDSRCPADGYCDWPGMAQVRMRMDLAADTFYLDLPMYGASVAADTADYMPLDTGGVRLILTSLRPYPPVGMDSTYLATILISPEQPADSVTGKVQLTNQTPSQIILRGQYLDSVDISGNLLEAFVQYPNGCMPKFNWAFMTPDSFLTAGTREADIYLRHFYFGVECPAVIVPDRDLFDLSDLIEQYWSQFNRLDPIALHLYVDDTNINVRTAIWYPPDWQPTPLLPMWVGTSWVFVDTNRTVEPMEVTTDTVEVTGTFTDSLGQWWTLSRPFPTTTDTIMVRGDTIFDRQYGLSGDTPLLNMIYPPAEDTTTSYTYLIGGCIASTRTARRVDSLINTPFGYVAGAYEYATYGVNETTRQLIVPGIGFVYYDWEVWQPIMVGPARRIVLTEIHLTR